MQHIFTHKHQIKQKWGRSQEPRAKSREPRVETKDSTHNNHFYFTISNSLILTQNYFKKTFKTRTYET